LKRALSVHKELQNRRNEAIVMSWLGDLYALQGDQEDARSSWERALAIHRQVGDPRGETLALSRLGALAKKNKLSAVAEEMFLRAKALVERLNDDELKGLLAIFDGTTTSPGNTEPERAALNVVKALGLR
jgi:hypothetical protein